MFYEWSDDLSVGVPSIDRQHKVLISLINELHIAMEQGRGASEAVHILKKLINYAKAHFIYEESLFKDINYMNEKEHIELHNKIKARLSELKEKSNEKNFGLSEELMIFLKNWLNHHILKEDMSYSALLVSNNTQ
ncbi:MAG: bacteriohemerythrin [Gammaproteobacteria bacterium]|nr:bacteriohemerythrin [Gammaproteobacteria bacterium]